MRIKGRKVRWSDIWFFNQGWFRYYLYYSKRLRWILPKHIREQIEFRINSMKRECYDRGQCIKCGCSTTALQMSDKSCEGLCYPAMMNKREWRKYSRWDCFYFCNRTLSFWDVKVKQRRFQLIIKSEDL